MALYRKYRPATFQEVVGQEQVTRPLSVALDSGRINHAYLFSGPRGCGKTSSARILARSLNCVEGPTSTPCGKCNSCVALAPNGPGTVDVIEMDAASNNGVDDMRELRDRAVYAPAESRYRIFIIDEAHMISNSGANALLKTVEEPPEHLIFIFATTEPEKVIGTIRSRTHHYPFRLLTPNSMEGLLRRTIEAEHVHVDPAVYPLVIAAGGGSPRDTLSVLDQLLSGSGSEGITYDLARLLLGVTDDAILDKAVLALAANDKARMFQLLDDVIESGADPRRFASDLLNRLRDLMVLHAVPDAFSSGLVSAPVDRQENLQQQAQAFQQRAITQLASTLQDGLLELRGATAPRLLLEILSAKLLLIMDQAGTAGASTSGAPEALGGHAAGNEAASSPAPESGSAAAALAAARAGVKRAASHTQNPRSAVHSARQAPRPAATPHVVAPTQNATPGQDPEAGAQGTAPTVAPTQHRQEPPASDSGLVSQTTPAPQTQVQESTPAIPEAEQPVSQQGAESAVTPQESAAPEARQTAQPTQVGPTAQPVQSAPSAQPVGWGEPAQPGISATAAGDKEPAESTAESLASGAHDVQAIIQQWPKILKAFGGQDKSGAMLAYGALPQRLENNVLVVGHATAPLIHRLQDATRLSKLEACIAEVTGQQLQVQFVAGTDPKVTGAKSPQPPAPSQPSTQQSAQQAESVVPREPATTRPRQGGFTSQPQAQSQPAAAPRHEEQSPAQHVTQQPAAQTAASATSAQASHMAPEEQQPQQPESAAIGWGEPAPLGGPKISEVPAAQQSEPSVTHKQPSAATPAPPQQQRKSGSSLRAKIQEVAEASARQRAAQAQHQFSDGTPLPPEPEPDAPEAPPQWDAPQPATDPNPTLSAPPTAEEREAEMMREASYGTGEKDHRNPLDVAVDVVIGELGGRRV
ncbi:MAG: DNA polymerase III subunit gamma and tau [Corynebacterium sp.]|nr:DNA polymerase III subunit gamma and tau [Corynebacterium sp.]